MFASPLFPPESIDSQIRDMVVKRVGRWIWELASKHPMPSELLGSDDAKVRFAALAQAVLQGEVTQELADKCEILARADSDADVRGTALTCLSSFYKRLNNRRIGALLATVVCNRLERTDVRWVAYSGLSQMPNAIDLSHSPVAPGFSFPADIDWTWVKSFLEGSVEDPKSGDGART
jgi:hypothetical protein